MFVAVNRIPVVDGCDDEFREAFEERTQHIRQQPGLHRVELLRPVDAEQYIIQAYWESRAAFDQWRNSEAFQAAHADLSEGLFAGSNHLELYECTGEIEP